MALCFLGLTPQSPVKSQRDYSLTFSGINLYQGSPSPVLLIDRLAAEADPLSQTKIWNKMPLNVFEQPLTSSSVNVFRGPQIRTTSALGFPHLPVIRRGHQMSLIDGRIKIVYVDQQGTNRKLSPNAHAGLVVVLQRLQSSPHFVEERTAQTEVQIAKFEDMSAEFQIQSAYDADMLCPRQWAE